jgi:hypothetical protein
MAQHFHAIVWIDHKQARIFHFNVDEAPPGRFGVDPTAPDKAAL